ncbi:MAG: Thymidylate kinase [Candidatus Izimaplasma bacterium HR2]|nr:MAG: Thymidylate kinase [Candidatus Izimaplasma bacterium HR2]
MKGKFITFEGPEGSGKSTVIVAVKDFLEKEGYSILTTREPGGIKIAEDIRSIILDKENTEMDAHAEALLFAASRSQHYNEKIKPALEADKIILCDRFIDSSLAYQGHARGLGIDNVYDINKFAIGNNLPELTIFIDVPPKLGLKRVFSNTRKVDRLDLETLEFHELVYEGYMLIAKKYDNRFKIVDGTNPVEQVVKDTLKIIKTII